MELKQTKLARADNRAGSALIMVVVLTVLLAVIGVLFVMVSRIDEMATSSVVYDHELDHAVDSVVELISQRLTDDLMMGEWGGTSYDYSSNNEASGDKWLSTTEPRSWGNNGTPEDYTDDIFEWPHVSDITGDIRRRNWSWSRLIAEVYQHADANDVMNVPDQIIASADADGDGVIDSLWVRLPGVTTGRGKPVFVAVRIIDNCSMLNLNTASYIDDPNVWPDREGRYLSSVDYRSFLRGTDRLNPEFIAYARQGGPRPVPPFIDPPDEYHQNAIMHIENPGPGYTLFDISDELEMRNRFLLTSLFQARFEREDVTYQTFDLDRGFWGGGGGLPQLKVKRIPFITSDFDGWKWRLDPINFDNDSGAYVDPANPLVSDAYKYDRRHVCTFYSFDRNLRLGYYPIDDSDGNPVTMIFDPDPWAVCTRIADWDPAIMPSGNYDYNNVETRMQILKLLYAFRAYYLTKSGGDFKQAARRAAQIVANMIDYADDTERQPDPPYTLPDPLTDTLMQGPFLPDGMQPDAYLPPNFWNYGRQTNDNPTYINRNVIRELIMEVSNHLSDGQNMIDIDVDTQYDFGIGVDDPDETIYGYERQPFISEIVRNETGGNIYYAIELCNPYVNPNGAISLDGWQIKIGSAVYPLASGIVWQGSLEVESASITGASRVLGRAVIVSDMEIVNPPPPVPIIVVAGMTIPTGEVVELQRPDPAVPGEFITVDKTEDSQAAYINGAGEWRVSKRDDTKWRFTNAGLHQEYDQEADQTLGRANDIDLSGEGYQMPVPDNNVPIGTLGDFEMVLTVGNEKSSDPNFTAQTVTEYVAAASDEGDVRTDVDAGSPYPLDYVCFVGRPEGTLAGRINVNTATKEVIQAAILPDAGVLPYDYEALAANIVQSRERGRPFQRITDLLRVPGFDQFATDPNGVGDPEMRHDFQEHNWILSRLANKLTVRSDVFTAYILVRLGHAGPQRRMIAIFDRSNVSLPIGNNKSEKPRIIALHPVSDPR